MENIIQRLRLNLPASLTQKPRFVCYRLRPRGTGRLGKVPVDTLSGLAVNHRDPRHHLAFEEALAALSSGQVSGVGYVVDQGEVLIDIDHCLQDGQLNAFASELVEEARTYAEISVSGSGVKLLVGGQKPGPACRGYHLELYGPGFYAALTGRRCTPFNVEERQEWLNATYARYLALPSGPAPTHLSVPLLLGDEEVLRRARLARNGTKFARLFDEGIVDDYPSLSEAQFALVRILRFWVGDRPEVIDRLFRNSAVMTAKWNRPLGDTTYGVRTIQRAMAMGGNVRWSSK